MGVQSEFEAPAPALPEFFLLGELGDGQEKKQNKNKKTRRAQEGW